MTLKVFEGFAGYGGGSFALKRIGADFEVVGYSEIDKNAIKCYDLNHPGHKNFGDISKIDPNDIPDFDLFLGGFPCQDVSLAGMRDLTKGRTNLYKEILRICSIKNPKMILLENVAGLLSMGDARKLIDIVVSDFKSLGYYVFWKKLNSKDFGIPQSRDRVWIVCFRADVYVPFKFQFPIEEPLKIFIKDILESDVPEKYYLKSNQVEKIRMNFAKKDSEIKRIGGMYDQATRRGVYDDDGLSPTLTASMGMGGGFVPMIPSYEPMIVASRKAERSKKKEDRVFTGQQLEPRRDGVSNTITTLQKDNYVLNPSISNSSPREIGFKEDVSPTLLARDYKDPKIVQGVGKTALRKLTPKECFRLMGFTSDEIILDGLSDTAKYKLAGNGWEIVLASKVLKQMLDATIE